MPFQPEEIFVGMIACYRIADLHRHKQILHTSDGYCEKPRPFICYAQDEQFTYWTYTTTVPKPMRPMISRRWFRHPRGLWDFGFVGNPIIGDPGHTYAGSAELFARLSHRVDRFQGISRPMLLRPGVAAIAGMVYRNGGLLPKDHPARMGVQIYVRKQQNIHLRAA